VRIGLHSAILCPHGCLAADTEDRLLVVLGVHTGREDAEWDFLSEEYYTSLEPPDLDLAEAPAQAHEYTTVE
jgi:hypothetical protein